MSIINEALEILTKKATTRTDIREKTGVVMLIFLILSGLSAFLGIVIVSKVLVVISLALMVAFHIQAYSDPEWRKGERYD